MVHETRDLRDLGGTYVHFLHYLQYAAGALVRLTQSWIFLDIK
jgi:hypothetical protein